MPAIDQTTAVELLTGLTGYGSYTATLTGLKCYLTINAPTATVDGTQLSGTGSTPIAVTWGAPTGTSSGAIITNTNTMTWTNGTMSAWTICGLELWDYNPSRRLFGIWNGQPYTVGPSSQFVVAAASLSIALP